jgi:hypothetical protein
MLPYEGDTGTMRHPRVADERLLGVPNRVKSTANSCGTEFLDARARLPEQQ